MRGAHAPSRVAECALALRRLERYCAPITRINARHITSRISGEGAGNSTRGRVRSPLGAPLPLPKGEGEEAIRLLSFKMNHDGAMNPHNQPQPGLRN